MVVKRSVENVICPLIFQNRVINVSVAVEAKSASEAFVSISMFSFCINIYIIPKSIVSEIKKGGLSFLSVKS